MANRGFMRGRDSGFAIAKAVGYCWGYRLLGRCRLLGRKVLEAMRREPKRLKRHISGHLVRTEMVAMMVVRVAFMLWGPHHSFMGSLDASAPANQRIYRLQIDRTAGDRAASTSRAALSDGEELPPPRVELHLRTLRN